MFRRFESYIYFQIMKILILTLLLTVATFSATILNTKEEYRTFVATAYSLRGKTASGQPVRHGIIAADPRVLKLGTKVHIEGMGNYIVKDTGGAIKGNRIDIWMPSKAQAMKFGRRHVKLKITR